MSATRQTYVGHEADSCRPKSGMLRRLDSHDASHLNTQAEIYYTWGISLHALCWTGMGLAICSPHLPKTKSVLKGFRA
eukprot:1827688-Amphidinium_carterae.1